MATTMGAQRLQLFGAGAVISVCATAAVDEMTDADELAGALRVAGQLIDDVAAALEHYSSDEAQRQGGQS